MNTKMSNSTEIRPRRPRKLSRDNSFCVLNNAELYRKLMTDDKSLPVKHEITVIKREKTRTSFSGSHQNKTGRYSLVRTETKVKSTGKAQTPHLISTSRYKLATSDSPRSILKKNSDRQKGVCKSGHKLDSESDTSSDDDVREPRFSYRLGPVHPQTKRVSFHPSSNTEPSPTRNSSYALNPNVRFIHPILNSTFYKVPDVVRCRLGRDGFEDTSSEKKT